MDLRSHNFYLSFLIFFIFFFYTSCSYLEDDYLVFENPYINLPSIGQNSASGYLLISNRSKDFYRLSIINCEGIRKTVFHKSERDPDTPVCSESYNIALKSAGAWLDGVDEILAGNSALILARPPGHHAEADRAMGFCLFSNAALAAVYALKQNVVNKVAIFDWDVHHGNGTQKILEVLPLKKLKIYFLSDFSQISF